MYVSKEVVVLDEVPVNLSRPNSSAHRRNYIRLLWINFIVRKRDKMYVE